MARDSPTQCHTHVRLSGWICLESQHNRAKGRRRQFASIHCGHFASAGLIIDDLNHSKDRLPRHGDVNFTIRTEGAPVDLRLRLRIPEWAKSWQVTPSPEQLDLRKGYLCLSAEWLQQNSQFQLSGPMQPRVAKPHPLTMQPVAYVTCGSIVYRVEDADHSWEERHFKVKHQISEESMQYMTLIIYR